MVPCCQCQSMMKNALVWIYLLLEFFFASYHSWVLYWNSLFLFSFLWQICIVPLQSPSFIRCLLWRKESMVTTNDDKRGRPWLEKWVPQPPRLQLYMYRYTGYQSNDVSCTVSWCAHCSRDKSLLDGLTRTSRVCVKEWETRWCRQLWQTDNYLAGISLASP